jgi:hypothetical protein
MVLRGEIGLPPATTPSAARTAGGVVSRLMQIRVAITAGAKMMA